MWRVQLIGVIITREVVWICSVSWFPPPVFSIDRECSYVRSYYPTEIPILQDFAILPATGYNIPTVSVRSSRTTVCNRWKQTIVPSNAPIIWRKAAWELLYELKVIISTHGIRLIRTQPAWRETTKLLTLRHPITRKIIAAISSAALFFWDNKDRR